ncbi:MAG: ExbD/TolR family protein [Planctomycetaceae bacterium]
MPLKTGTIEEPELNLTSMIDIVFLLIIFFMVGTQFAEPEDRFQVELPTAGAVQPLSEGPDAMVVSVAKDGRILVGEDRLTIDELETKFVEARENYPAQAVVVRGEGEGRYQAVIDVLAAANRAEMADVSLAYKTEQQ